MDRVRVLRIIEYEGPRDWVETTVAKSIHGTHIIDGKPDVTKIIKAATLGTYPEILKAEA